MVFFWLAIERLSLRIGRPVIRWGCLVLAAIWLLLLFSRPVAANETLTQGGTLLERVNARIGNIGTRELKVLIEEQPDAVLIDVRTPGEVTLMGGMIAAPRSYNIPRGWLEFRVQEIVPVKDDPIVVYCGINQRSPLAADTLLQLGYSNVKNYADGIFSWKSAGLPVESMDRALDSMLYSRPEQVVENVWSAIGATAPPSYTNSGHNNNLSFVVTDDGVLVVNAGDNYLLARALHEEIKKITDQPVRYVVLENGQGHAMLGMNYWQEQGVPVIAHVDAAREIEEHGVSILERMRARNRDKAMGTRLARPDQVFDEKLDIQLGSERIVLLHLGPAHSPGDIIVWLPRKSLVISGDMAFHQRLLPVFEDTDTAAWIETWEKFAELNAKYLIPGHGEPTNMKEVTRYTRDYLVFLRAKVAAVLDEGGDLQSAYQIDQSAYRHLDTYEELAKQNAGRVFRAMEFE